MGRAMTTHKRKHKAARDDKVADGALDEALRETFPASDPIAVSVDGSSLIATSKSDVAKLRQGAETEDKSEGGEKDRS